MHKIPVQKTGSLKVLSRRIWCVAGA